MSGYRHAFARFAVTVTVAAAGAVALPGTAVAGQEPKPKPVCNLVVDPVGDAPDVVDVYSGDIATGDTTVVGVLRLRRLGATNDPTTQSGARWDLAFDAGTSRYTFSTRRDSFGTITSTFTRSTNGGPAAVAGPVSVVLDITRNQIVWTVSRASVPDLPAKPSGDLIQRIAAVTFTTPLDRVADVATSTRTYADGWPSCVTAA